MSTTPVVQPHHLRRKAVIYIRQSTGHQVLTNIESQQRALLRVGGGLHLHLKQRFEGAIDPGKSQVYQMVEALLTPPHSTPLEALLDQPFASAFNHPPPQR